MSKELDGPAWTVTAAYIADLQSRMWLTHWRVLLQHDQHERSLSDEDGANAVTEPLTGRHVAQIWFREGWYEDETESQRDKTITCVHELLHLHHRDQTDLIRTSLHETGALGQQTYDLLWAAFIDATERMVDLVATAWAGSLPPWPGPCTENPAPASKTTKED